jgi:glycosyltransferase involved in cell wall biosynthesis
VKIILSTYNFYPTYKGGTEVYTRALAKYLIQQGHEVLIVAAFDDGMEAGENYAVWFDDEAVKAGHYQYEKLHVLGIALKEQSANDIYAGSNEQWTAVFTNLLREHGWADTGHLILNGLSTVSGISLGDAVLRNNQQAKISVVVHTPFVCARADMINAKTGSRCEVKMSSGVCAACFMTLHTRIPYGITRLITGLVNNTFLSRLSSATALRLPQLVQMKLDGLQRLDKMVQRWIVLSNDMKAFMGRQYFISAEKIVMLRHGIDTGIFFKGGVKSVAPVRLLYAGRFEEIKGVRVLAAAWLQLPDKPEERQLTLAGNWRANEFGKGIYAMLSGRKDVAFIETLSQMELADLYRSTHCVIIPSRWVETGPMVIHEAIACGCDIISSDIGGQGELAAVYPEKSHVFTSGDTASLYKVLFQYKPIEKGISYSPVSAVEHFNQLKNSLGIA